MALAPRRGSSSTAIYCIEATPSSDRCGFEALWYKYYYHALHIEGNAWAGPRTRGRNPTATQISWEISGNRLS